MKIHRAAVGIQFRLPDTLIDRIAEQCDAAVMNEQQQKFVFLVGEHHGFSAFGNLHGSRFDHNVSDLVAFFHLTRAPENAFHPSNQLYDLKGLYQVVVCAGTQTLHPVSHRTFRRDKYNRCPGRADLLHQFIPVRSGKHNIQKDQIVAVLFD